MAKVYLGLGGNVGDSSETIISALERLCDNQKFIAISHPYQTPPWGYENQAPFINACAIIETKDRPEVLLESCHAIERHFGRERVEKWGPRTIDIDLLVMDGVTRNSPNIMLPHPYITQRAFVLIPLNEIAPQLEIAGKTVEKWCDAIDASAIIKLQPTEHWSRFINSSSTIKV